MLDCSVAADGSIDAACLGGTGPSLSGTDPSAFSLSGLGSFFSQLGSTIGSVYKTVTQPGVAVQPVPGGFVTPQGQFVNTSGGLGGLFSGSNGTMFLIGGIILLFVLLRRK